MGRHQVFNCFSAYCRKLKAGPGRYTAMSLPRLPAHADRLARLGTTDGNALCLRIGRAVGWFALAQIRQLQDAAVAREEEPRLTDCPREGKQYQTFENAILEAPEKGCVTPVTVSTEAKTALGAMFLSVADLVAAAGGRMAAARALGAGPHAEDGVAAVIVAVATHAAPLLAAQPLSRDLGVPEDLCKRFEKFVGAAAVTDPGAAEFARCFTNFLKVIGWHAGARAYEAGHVTVNRACLLQILTGMGASFPALLPRVLACTSFAGEAIEHWAATVEVAKKAAAPKAASSKAPVTLVLPPGFKPGVSRSGVPTVAAAGAAAIASGLPPGFRPGFARPVAAAPTPEPATATATAEAAVAAPMAAVAAPMAAVATPAIVINTDPALLQQRLEASAPNVVTVAAPLDYGDDFVVVPAEVVSATPVPATPAPAA